MSGRKVLGISIIFMLAGTIALLALSQAEYNQIGRAGYESGYTCHLRTRAEAKNKLNANLRAYGKDQEKCQAYTSGFQQGYDDWRAKKPNNSLILYPMSSE
jgi:NADH:ubiquinone oxidoreductase subunit 3 (subunit A)